VDIQNMNSCSFQNGTNPITNKKCQQAFQTLNQNEMLDNNQIMLPSDPMAQLYFVGLSALAIYILYGLMEKNNGKK
jgi:hypothetical protein